MRAEGGMERKVMMGQMEGKWRRGRPRQRWMDRVRELTARAVAQDERCRIVDDGERSPSWSPGVGRDSTEHCDIVSKKNKRLN